MAVNYNLKGVEELKKKLEALSDVSRSQVLLSAARKSMQVYSKSARSKAPVADGDLRNSIGPEKVKGNGREKIALAVGPRRRKGSKNAQGWHAHLVEYGTIRRHAVGKNTLRRRGNKRVAVIGGKTVMVEHTGTMPAQPFLRPAWDETNQKVLSSFSDELAKKIEKAVKK